MIEWAFQKEFGVDEKYEIAEFLMLFDGRYIVEVCCLLCRGEHQEMHK